MDIEELRERKRKLEKSIHLAVQDRLHNFEKDTGVTATGVDITTAQLMQGFPRTITESIVTSVEVTLDI